MGLEMKKKREPTGGLRRSGTGLDSGLGKEGRMRLVGTWWKGDNLKPWVTAVITTVEVLSTPASMSSSLHNVVANGTALTTAADYASNHEIPHAELKTDLRSCRPQIVGPDIPLEPFPIQLAGHVKKGFGRGGKDLGCPTGSS